MGSIFINAGIAAGVALAAIPVILHLFMKQTPKHVVFPALRLIRKREERTRKKLKIKNWLLLLARMALLALMALALARPRFDAKIKAGDDQVETAIAMVFDTSLSMSYTEHDKSRLDEAKELADQILSRTHPSSQVFFLDSARATEPVAISPGAARKAIAALEIEPANQPVNQALGLAYAAVLASDKPRREVFVFTDLARSAWAVNQGVSNRDEAEKVPGGVGTYILDLSAPPDQRHDVAIARVEPENSVVGQDEPVPIRVHLRATGKPAQRLVEFYLDGVKKDQKTVDVPADSEVEVPQFLPRVEAGLHRVAIRLAGEPDPIPFNDVHYLTFEARPPVKVLVLSDRNEDADHVANALDPVEWRGREDAPRPYHVEQRLTSGLDIPALRRDLAGFAGVFVLNVERPTAELWQALDEFIKRGGGVVIGVGDRVAAGRDAYNESAVAQGLLPATLGPVRVHDEFSFGRADIGNALFAHGQPDVFLAELARVPVFKSMTVEPAADARTLLWYQDESPALLERTITSEAGTAGRVLLWTTALVSVPDPTRAWNQFPIANWSFFQLMNQTVPYLAGSAGRRLSVEAGETVSLPVDASKRFTDFNAQPNGEAAPIRLNEPTLGRPLLIATRATNLKPENLLGQWTVTASRAGGPSQTMGFSVNPPAAESQLAAVEAADLDRLLGKDGYRVADSPQDLKRKVEETTIGREVFPWIMLGILFVVTLENALANTFYRDRPAAAAAAAPRAAAGA
jgi:hypothetical protein